MSKYTEYEKLAKNQWQEHQKNKKVIKMKKIEEFTDRKLLKELAKRIVAKKLELDKPQDWIISKKTPEEIVENLRNKMGLCNKDGFALTNIHEIYDEKTNPNPLQSSF